MLRKLLYNVLKKTAALKARVKGETVAERAKWLARVRDGESYMAQFTTSEKVVPDSRVSLADHEFDRQYPIIARLQQDMFEALLGTRVRRGCFATPGCECAFYFAS
jgi:predicted ArsR family transcriptional regulator